MSRNILIALCLVASAVLSAPNAQANLVVDGNFAADTLDDPPNPPWTSSGVYIDNTFICCGDTQDAEFSSGGTLSQTLPTIAGDSYVLDFWVLDESSLFFDTFTVSLGTTFSETITGDEASSYTEFTYTVPGTDIAGDDILSFAAYNALGDDWNLDAVSVTPVSVPEPSSLSLLGSSLLGIVGLLAAGRRRDKNRVSRA